MLDGAKQRCRLPAPTTNGLRTKTPNNALRTDLISKGPYPSELREPLDGRLGLTWHGKWPGPSAGVLCDEVYFIARSGELVGHHYGNIFEVAAGTRKERCYEIRIFMAVSVVSTMVIPSVHYAKDVPRSSLRKNKPRTAAASFTIGREVILPPAGFRGAGHGDLHRNSRYHRTSVAPRVMRARHPAGGPDDRAGSSERLAWSGEDAQALTTSKSLG